MKTKTRIMKDIKDNAYSLVNEFKAKREEKIKKLSGWERELEGLKSRMNQIDETRKNLNLVKEEDRRKSHDLSMEEIDIKSRINRIQEEITNIEAELINPPSFGEHPEFLQFLLVLTMND